MLVEFKVKNYLSFKEEVLFSMEAGSTSKRPMNVFECGQESLLKNAALYGANASGKSNLIKAFAFIRHLLLRDYNLEKNKIEAVPFKLSAETEEKSSSFEIVFISKGVKYVYSFELNQDMILKEELYEFPRKKLVFKRNRKSIEAGTKLKRIKKELPLPKERELYLSTLARAFDVIEDDIISWFRKLEIVTNGVNFTSTIKQLSENGISKERVLDHLKRADINIDDFLIQTDKVDMKSMPLEEQAIYGRLSMNSAGNLMRTRLETIKQKYDKDKNPAGKVIFNFFKEESAGTQHFFKFLGPIFDVIDNNKILIVDELENSFHPLLLKFLVSIFNSEENKEAQLIFTAHDISLLASDSPLRRDQIWFADKNKYGATSLYSLLEFKDTREDQDFQKKYLLGNFGAIPLIEDI
ncbi:MAG: ATP-binding protein [Candidatus Paceibacterota bacterium]